MRFNLVNAFGISTNISLNSFMKGGSTKTIDIKNIIVKVNQTKRRDIGLDIFKSFFNLLHKLQTMLEITREHIISKKKSFKLQNNKILINKIDSFKMRLLFKF